MITFNPRSIQPGNPFRGDLGQDARRWVSEAQVPHCHAQRFEGAVSVLQSLFRDIRLTFLLTDVPVVTASCSVSPLDTAEPLHRSPPSSMLLAVFGLPVDWSASSVVSSRMLRCIPLCNVRVLTVCALSSTGGQHGGQETTAFTTLPFFVHHGISFVPIGYVNQGLSKIDGIHGGAPWGAASEPNDPGTMKKAHSCLF